MSKSPAWGGNASKDLFNKQPANKPGPNGAKPNAAPAKANAAPAKPTAAKPAQPKMANTAVAAKGVNKAANAFKAGVGANAIKSGDKAGGHLSDRHVKIGHGDMIDRLHGKDPGQTTFKDKQRKEVVSKFASSNDANKAMAVAMKDPKVQAAASKLGNNKIAAPIKVDLPKGMKVKQEIMQGPGFVKVGNKKIPRQGPANLIKKDVKSVTVAVRKDAKGKTGMHTGYSNPD